MEVWTYAGKRINNTKLSDCWYDGDKLLYYTGFGAGSVGSMYEIDVTREDDSIKVRTTRPKYIGKRHPDADMVARFVTQDLSDRAKYRAIRDEKKDPGALDEAMEPLLAYARAANRTSGGKDALVAAVIRRLYDVW